MTETNKPPIQQLESIRASLVNLHGQSIHPAAKQEVDKALARLSSVMEEISSGEEQARLAALYRVSQALGTSLNLDEVLNQVMDAVIGLTEAERGFLMLVEGEGEELAVRVGRNLEQETLDQDEMKVSRTVLRTVLDSGTGVVTTNAQEDPRFSRQESVVSFSLRSIMCAPLRSRGGTTGVIYVDSRAQVGLFTKDDLDMLNAFASQAAAAIQNAQLYTRTDQSLADRVEELERLARFARTVSHHETLQAVLETTRRWAIEGTTAQEVWIALLEEDQEKQTATIAIGPDQGQSLPLDHPYLNPVLASNTPHIFDIQAGGTARLAVPILGPQNTIGVLVAERPQAFPPDDLPFLTRLVNQASVAVGKVNLSDQIAGADLEKAAFVSTVAHELRIPMTSIMGYTDLLKQGAMGEVNENQLNFLTVIRENVGRMSKLVSDLSDIYKLQSGRMHLEPVKLSIREVVDKAAEDLQPSLTAKEQQLEIHIVDGLPSLSADPSRVQQAISYLIDNASRYSPAGSAIEVRTKVEGEFIRILVKDNGLGIGPEDQENMYTQFFRSERMEVREEKGWGLSLSLVKDLITLMGGETGFESQLDRGSAFWFTLPMTG